MIASAANWELTKAKTSLSPAFLALLAGESVENFRYVDRLVLTRDVLESGTEPLLEFVK